jgi:hypothetical protein
MSGARDSACTARGGSFGARAKDEAAKAFYQRFDFVPSPVNDHHLCLLMKDVRLIVQGS